MKYFRLLSEQFKQWVPGEFNVVAILVFSGFYD